MTDHGIMSLLLVMFAGIAVCMDGSEQLFNSTEYNLMNAVTNNNTDYTTFTEIVTNDNTDYTTFTETMTTVPNNVNVTCQEGPEVGEPPANETCDCGPHGYFYGNYCQNVNLSAASDINTSKRVMEIQWRTDPNFNRSYSFVYRELDSDDAPLSQPVVVKPATEYFYAWLTYLKSGEVKYIVCVMEENVASDIIENDDRSRLDDVNPDCVKIQTQLSVTREKTTAAILVGAGMGITLIIIFTANLCVNRQKIVRSAEDEYSDRVEQTLVLTRDMNVVQQGYLDMYDRIQYAPQNHAM